MTTSVKISLKKLCIDSVPSFLYSLNVALDLKGSNLHYLKMYSLFLIIILMLMKYHVNLHTSLFFASLLK